MTVPPLFGWEHIVTVLLILVALAVAFLVISAAGSNTRGRAEWQAFLDARSHGSGEPVTDGRDGSSAPGTRERLPGTPHAVPEG